MLPTERGRSGSRAAAEGVATGDMLAQYAYCPRRFHLVYVEGRWADNLATDEGRWAHRNVDGDGEAVANGDLPGIQRSVSLSDETLGLHAKLDLIECASTAPDGPMVAVPVEFKRGHTPETPEGTWEPERVQLMAQGLLLRANGFAATKGVVYYAASRRRVTVEFTPELEQRTRDLLRSVHDALSATVLPSPTEDHRKCPGCSLAAICLPDETLALSLAGASADGGAPEVRRLYPARDDALPLYVQEQGSMVGHRGELLHVTRGGERLGDARLKDVSQLVLCGAVTVSASAIHLLCEAGVPIVHLSRGHWFYGITNGMTLRNAFDRAAQFRAAEDPTRCLELARAFVLAKGTNQRTLLRRNSVGGVDTSLKEMSRLLSRVNACESLESLLGIEGNLASHYFRNFGRMLKARTPGGAQAADELPPFDFERRNRRPPRDPVNAMISFAYALLVKECTVALLSAGLDPYWGFFHQPRHGRPALALDLMEEMRPLVADSAVITAINTGMVGRSDFIETTGACALNDRGRKGLIRAFEGRLDQLATHPVFDYRCSWRRLLATQAQLLARFLRRDIAEYQGITTR